MRVRRGSQVVSPAPMERSCVCSATARWPAFSCGAQAVVMAVTALVFSVGSVQHPCVPVVVVITVC